MNQSTREVMEVLLGYAAAWSFVVIGLSAWVGKVVAERIARKEKARIERDALEHSDALTRKRDVYSRLATAMRVFHTAAVPAGPKEKQEFTLLTTRHAYGRPRPSSKTWACFWTR